MKDKLRFFGIIVLSAVLIFGMVGCGGAGISDEPDVAGNTPESTVDTRGAPSGTYTSTKSGVSYTLVVSPSQARAVHAVGDTFTLTVKNGATEKTSTGKLVEVTDSTLSVQPSYKDAPIYTIIISGTRITYISGVITFDDGSTIQGPGSFTTSSGGGGSTQGATIQNTSTPANVAVTGVTLNKMSTALLVGGTETLYAGVAPSNATNQNVTWISSNTGVAVVSAGGVVTSVATGMATITVTTIDGGKTTACTVTVTPVLPEGVTLDRTSANITVGDTETLIATITPANATNQNVTWSSSNTAIASVSADGTITAVAVGTATITATTVAGGKTAACAVTVTAPVPVSEKDAVARIGNTLTPRFTRPLKRLLPVPAITPQK